jgi:hypothetical protein
VSGRAFTVDERDRVRDRVLAMARTDARVVACAIVGSLAMGGGDRWSDLDLTFGLAPGTSPAAILGEWTPVLEREFGAVHLFDLPYLTTLYRVFLFPGSLQVDLSFTPGAEFGALGPRFELLFGTTVERAHIPSPSAAYLFGLGVHHAVRARFSIERGRLWQAEYWVRGVRDQAMSLACLARGLPPGHGRGYDALPADALALFAAALARSIDRDELLRALRAAIEALLVEARDVGERTAQVETELRGLVSPGWPPGT